MAIKSLKTLIRLHKRELDELRRKMASLQDQKQKLIQLTRKLQEQLLQEQQRATSMPEMASFFGSYAARIRKRQEEIAAEIAKLDKEIDTLNGEIMIKFGEQKKYEILRDRLLERQREAEAKRETLELDEIAIQQFLRQEQDEPQ